MHQVEVSGAKSTGFALFLPTSFLQLLAQCEAESRNFAAVSRVLHHAANMCEFCWKRMSKGMTWKKKIHISWSTYMMTNNSTTVLTVYMWCYMWLVALEGTSTYISPTHEPEIILTLCQNCSHEGIGYWSNLDDIPVSWADTQFDSATVQNPNLWEYKEKLLLAKPILLILAPLKGGLYYCVWLLYCE